MTLLRHLLLEGKPAWTFDYGGEWPVAWLDTPNGLQVVYTDAGGYDISAVAEVWPAGTPYDEVGGSDENGEDLKPLSRVIITADGSGSREYSQVNKVSGLLDDEQAQKAWVFLLARGKPDPYLVKR